MSLCPGDLCLTVAVEQPHTSRNRHVWLVSPAHPGRSPVKRHDAFCRPSFSPCSLSLFAFRGVIFEAHLPSQRVFMQRPRLRWARPFWLTQVFTHVRVTPSVFCSWHSLLREDPHPASPRPAPCTEEGAANDISLLSSVSLATRVTKTTHVYVSICTCM